MLQPFKAVQNAVPSTRLWSFILGLFCIGNFVYLYYKTRKCFPLFLDKQTAFQLKEDLQQKETVIASLEVNSILLHVLSYYMNYESNNFWALGAIKYPKPWGLNKIKFLRNSGLRYQKTSKLWFNSVMQLSLVRNHVSCSIASQIYGWLIESTWPRGSQIDLWDQTTASFSSFKNVL